MDTAEQTYWIESLLSYLLFDLAFIGIIATGYFGIKLMLTILHKNTKNSSQHY